MKRESSDDAMEVIWTILALHDRTMEVIRREPDEPDFVDQPGTPYRTAPRRVLPTASWRRRAVILIQAWMRIVIAHLDVYR